MPVGNLTDPISGALISPSSARSGVAASLAGRALRAYRGDMSTDGKPPGAASEDVKRKFREALDNKNAHHREGEAHLDGESAIHHTHEAMTKREFRRKSG